MYGYRREDLGVTRFYTSAPIRDAMFQMHEFDSTLRSTIETAKTNGTSLEVQFIGRDASGTIVPCSPNKILLSATQTLRPFKRMLPIGFKTGHRTGQHQIGLTVQRLDSLIASLCGFGAPEPVPVPITTAIEILSHIESTMHFPEDDAPDFDWAGAKAVLYHLTQQHPDPSQRGKVLLWAAKDREASRFASPGSHAKYIESPDSQKTEGELAKQYAIDLPILFLLRQNGSREKDWSGTPFYWPVIRAQKNTPAAVYTSETI
jgi:hypothetical protein